MKFFPRVILLSLLFCLVSFASLSAEDTHVNTLVEKGELLIQQEAYPAGIAVLETALTKDPENIKALSTLLEACDAYSQKLISQNRFDQAQVYLKKMEDVMGKIDQIPPREFSSGELRNQSRVKREMASAKSFLSDSDQARQIDVMTLNAGRELYNEAVEHFNKRQYEMAESMLKESVDQDPTNPYAYELLGEIANLNHDLDTAESYYKKAFSLNPDSKLREKYEKLVREKDIDKEHQQYSDEHFIIRYKRSENLEGSKIRDFLRDAYRAISQDFGHYPKYKIPIVFYDRSEYESLMGSVPHWSGALYDGKIRLPVYGSVITSTREQDLKKLIYHELAHAFVLDLSRMQCPVWLNEGLAQYEENKVTPINLDLLANAVRTKTLVAMGELIYEDVAKISSQGRAVLFYLESFSFVTYLIEHSRFYNLKQFLIELGKSTPFLDAFEKAFERTFKDFSGEWQRDLEQRYSG